MDSGANITPVEVIKESSFGGTYFRDIYSVLTESGKKSWKEFDQFKDINQKYYCSNYNNASVNKYGVKCRILLRLWEMDGLMKKNLTDGFSGILDTG